MPPSLGLLRFGVLKAIAFVVLAFFAVSLGPAVWADPHAAFWLGSESSDGGDAAALFRAATGADAREKSDAAQTALLARFPPGSDASSLVAFLTAEGVDRSGRCERQVSDPGVSGYYCHVQYGSLAALILGLDRWRYAEWVVGVSLAADGETIDRISVRIPLLGKG